MQLYGCIITKCIHRGLGIDHLKDWTEIEKHHIIGFYCPSHKYLYLHINMYQKKYQATHITLILHQCAPMLIICTVIIWLNPSQPPSHPMCAVRRVRRKWKWNVCLFFSVHISAIFHIFLGKGLVAVMLDMLVSHFIQNLVNISNYLSTSDFDFIWTWFFRALNHLSFYIIVHRT